VNIAYWVRRPHLIVARIRYWLWEQANPDQPWFCPGAVLFCEGILTQSMQVLEFGSGRSTLWFAHRVGRIASVEHSPLWFGRVESAIARNQLKNVDYRFVPLDHSETEPEQESYDHLPKYVSVLDTFPNQSLDLVLVDGHYRTACIRQCTPKVKPGGFLLVDDVDIWGGVERVPTGSAWSLVHESTNGLKSTAVWQRLKVSEHS